MVSRYIFQPFTSVSWSPSYTLCGSPISFLLWSNNVYIYILSSGFLLLPDYSFKKQLNGNEQVQYQLPSSTSLKWPFLTPWELLPCPLKFLGYFSINLLSITRYNRNHGSKEKEKVQHVYPEAPQKLLSCLLLFPLIWVLLGFGPMLIHFHQRFNYVPGFWSLVY